MAKEARETIRINLRKSWLDHITALALIDESPTIAYQIRRAVNEYLLQPPEADRRLQLRQVTPEDGSERQQSVSVNIPSYKLNLLGELAQTYSVTSADHIRAALNSYFIQRLDEAALSGQIELVMDHIYPQSFEDFDPTA